MGDGDVVNYIWYSEVVTNYVATVVVTISATNGTNHTVTSLIENPTTSTAIVTTDSFEDSGYTPINDTIISMGSVMLFVSPEQMLFGSNLLTQTLEHIPRHT